MVNEHGGCGRKGRSLALWFTGPQSFVDHFVTIWGSWNFLAEVGLFAAVRCDGEARNTSSEVCWVEETEIDEEVSGAGAAMRRWGTIVQRLRLSTTRGKLGMDVLFL